MKTKPDEISKSKKHYDWAVMPDLYFATSLLLCEQLLKHTEFPRDVIGGSEILAGFGFPSHPNYELVLPLVFNFKHAIELNIKYLGIIDYGTYKKEHDFKILTRLLKSKAKGTENQEIVDFLYEKSWPIIKKYYYGRYIPMNKKNNFPDKMNEAERYAEYRGKKSHGKKTGRIYRIPDRNEWVTKTVLSKIKNDIVSIEQLFSDVGRKIKPRKKFIYGRGKKFI